MNDQDLSQEEIIEKYIGNIKNILLHNYTNFNNLGKIIYDFMIL